jgi:hypothetical protein
LDLGGVLPAGLKRVASLTIFALLYKSRSPLPPSSLILIPPPLLTMKPTNNSNNFLLFLLPLLIPFTFGQLLLPSTHSPTALSSAMASSSSRRPCPCPTAKQSQMAIPKMKVVKVQAKAPDKGGEEKLAPLVMDESLLGALRDVGQRLAPFKTGGGSGKGKKKKKATGRTTKRLNRRHNRPKRQQQPNQIVDPALAGPEGTKCNSERIRQIIRKVGTVDIFWRNNFYGIKLF